LARGSFYVIIIGIKFKVVQIMRIAFFLGGHSNVYHNTGLKILEYLDDGEKPMSRIIKDFGYPELLSIPIAKYSKEEHEDISLISASDEGIEANKSFTDFIVHLAQKYHGSVWHQTPDNYLIGELVKFQEVYPRIRLDSDKGYFYTMDISKDLFNMIMNFHKL
jgi:hypothetical protein